MEQQTSFDSGSSNYRRDRGGNGKVCEAIKAHFDVLEYIQSCGYHFTEKKRGEYQCVEHDSMWVTPAKNIFVWNSRGKGGSVIDFVMLEEGLTFEDAVSKLRVEMSGRTPTYSPVKYEVFKKAPKKPFLLPEAHAGKYSRVFAYLTKTRGIDSAVVADLVKRKFLYESAKHHNCVFVGYDYDKTARFACVRSTGSTKFGIDVEGCEKIGWVVNPDKPALFVSEAPIDAMSIMTMLKLGGKDYNHYSHYAQSGNPPGGMLQHHIKNNPAVKTVYLCFDRDAAGEIFAAKAKRELLSVGFAGTILRKTPLTKDFNSDLQEHRRQTAPHTPAKLQNTTQEVTRCTQPFSPR